jgi:hypothetical protein
LNSDDERLLCGELRQGWNVGPIADFTNIIEGTQYPTSNLYVPMVCKMINKLDPASILKKPWDGTSLLSTPSTDLYKAHVALHTDMKQRMIENLKESTRIKFIISTMLDPRFKNFNFKGHQMFCESKDRAERYLRDEYVTNWAPILATPNGQ